MLTFVVAIDKKKPKAMQIIDKRLWDCGLPQRELAKRGIFPEAVFEIQAETFEEAREKLLGWIQAARAARGLPAATGLQEVFHEIGEREYQQARGVKAN